MRDNLPTKQILLINIIIERQLTDAKNAELLERYDWWFVPVANPDGYDYSWTKVRNRINYCHLIICCFIVIFHRTGPHVAQKSITWSFFLLRSGS